MAARGNSFRDRLLGSRITPLRWSIELLDPTVLEALK